MLIEAYRSLVRPMPEPTGVTLPPPPPLRRALAPLLDALVSPDEAYRRAAVRVVRETASAANVTHLADGLLDRLLHGGDVRRQAIRSLTAMGEYVLPALTERFRRTRDVATQLRVVEILGGLAPRGDPMRRFTVLWELRQLAQYSLDPPVAAALEQVAARIRAEDQAGDPGRQPSPGLAGRPANGLSPPPAQPTQASNAATNNVPGGCADLRR
jgi:hypothetical protein